MSIYVQFDGTINHQRRFSSVLTSYIYWIILNYYMFSSLVHTWSLLSLCFPFLQTVLRLVCFMAGVGYISPVPLRDRKGGTFGASGGASIKPWVARTRTPHPNYFLQMFQVPGGHSMNRAMFFVWIGKIKQQRN